MNHRQTAEAYAEEARPSVFFEPQSREDCVAVTQLAQVHATLALADEMRVLVRALELASKGRRTVYVNPVQKRSGAAA
jgi:hypothetical protein